jgi:hypothetical protein
MKIIHELNRFFTNVETTFNIAAALPFVSVPSSAIRVAFGVAQMNIGLGVGIASAAHLLMKTITPNRNWKLLSDAGFEHTIHGALNIIRGLGELVVAIISAVYTFGVASIILAPINLNTAFKPKLPYGFWTEPAAVPLRTA